MNIDDVDRKIIGELQKDAGASNTTIASKVGVSDVTVAGRIRRLIEHHVIRPTIFYDPREDGHTIYSVAQIWVEGRTVREVALDITDIDALQTVITMVGSPDLMVLFFARNVEEVEGVRQTIANVRGVKIIDLAMSLKLLKFHNSYGAYAMLGDDENNADDE